MSRHYDKYLEHQDQSPLGKLQQQYWTTKQQVIKKLGKREDEFVVLSDADLDAKLELFRSVKQSSNDLLRILEHYQEKLCALSIEEAEMSRFLKEYSQYDKTRAGKMMSSVAKAQNFSSQQRLALRVPLARLYNEVETFRYRAITDTWLTVRKMENSRTEYRGALLWMKDISNELDPDTSKKLEKFRRVQAQVKQTKTKFDRIKTDVQQKIDLLIASRCNMFSNVLINYQQCLINFWLKTSKTMNAVADAFKGYQYYEFNIIKDLQEPSKRLAEIAASAQSSSSDVTNQQNDNQNNDKNQNSLIQLDEQNDKIKCENNENTGECDKLIDIENTNRYNEDNIIELIDALTSNEANNLNEQLKELELLEKFRKINDSDKIKAQQMQKSNKYEEMDDDLNKNDENLYKDLLIHSNDEFEKEWESVFGGVNSNLTQKQQKFDDIHSSSSSSINNEQINQMMSTMNLINEQNYFPSQLLNKNSQQKPTQKQENENKNQTKKKKDMSSWYNLFADLDPLQNPDAIGLDKKESEEERNC